MKTTLQRIKEFIDFKVITNQKFEIEIGFSNGAFSTQLKNNKTIGVDKLENILIKYPEINPEWLLTGQGEMLKKNTDVIIKSYPKAKTEIKKIPLIPVEVLAGLRKGEFYINEDDVEEYYLVPDFKDADFLVKITGSSMQPKYNSGDVVACKKINLDKIFFQWNRTYVIDTEQGVIIKRICKAVGSDNLLIVSDNEKYQPFELNIKEINTISLVIGVLRRE